MPEKVPFKPKKLFFRKAQSITEYVILVAAVAAALAGMQVYMKRGIQAGVKLVSDRAGRQVDSLEVDSRVNWIVKGESNTTDNAAEAKRITKSQDGRVGYERNEASSQNGTISYSLFREK